MNSSKKPQIAVRAIITNSERKILILKRANTSYGNGCWNLPGGKIDFGETAEQAIIKEIKEEINLDCSSAQFLFYLDNLPNEMADLHFVTLFFECKCTGGIKLNPESSDYRWIDSSELPKYDLVFENDLAIEKSRNINN
jgi:8-oxo-dGTP diphosphatase